MSLCYWIVFWINLFVDITYPFYVIILLIRYGIVDCWYILIFHRRLILIITCDVVDVTFVFFVLLFSYINDITCDDSYQSPMKNKNVSTINNSVYYELDEHVDTISDSNKHVDLRKYPIAETHIVDRVCNLSVRVGLFKPAVVIGGIIGPVTDVLENSSVELPLGSQCKSVGVNRNILNCTSPDSRNIWPNNSWIVAPRVNEGIFVKS